MKVTKIYNKLSLWRDKNTPFTGLIDWIRDLLWDRYYEESLKVKGTERSK